MLIKGISTALDVTFSIQNSTFKIQHLQFQSFSVNRKISPKTPLAVTAAPAPAP